MCVPSQNFEKFESIIRHLPNPDRLIVATRGNKKPGDCVRRIFVSVTERADSNRPDTSIMTILVVITDERNGIFSIKRFPIDNFLYFVFGKRCITEASDEQFAIQSSGDYFISVGTKCDAVYRSFMIIKPPKVFPSIVIQPPNSNDSVLTARYNVLRIRRKHCLVDKIVLKAR